MLIRVHRSNPPGGPWFAHDSTGAINDFISYAPWLDKNIEGQTAWVNATLSDDGAIWEFHSVSNAPPEAGDE